MKIPLSMENLAPDMDAVILRVGDSDWQIDVWRDGDGSVHILSTPLASPGKQEHAILGQEGIKAR